MAKPVVPLIDSTGKLTVDLYRSAVVDIHTSLGLAELRSSEFGTRSLQGGSPVPNAPFKQGGSCFLASPTEVLAAVAQLAPFGTPLPGASCTFVPESLRRTKKGKKIEMFFPLNQLSLADKSQWTQDHRLSSTLQAAAGPWKNAKARLLWKLNKGTPFPAELSAFKDFDFADAHGTVESHASIVVKSQAAVKLPVGAEPQTTPACYVDAIAQLPWQRFGMILKASAEPVPDWFDDDFAETLVPALAAVANNEYDALLAATVCDFLDELAELPAPTLANRSTHTSFWRSWFGVIHFVLRSVGETEACEELGAFEVSRTSRVRLVVLAPRFLLCLLSVQHH